MTITQVVIAKLFMVSKIQVTTLPQLETPLMCLLSSLQTLFIRLAYAVWMSGNILESHPKQSEVFVVYDIV